MNCRLMVCFLLLSFPTVSSADISADATVAIPDVYRKKLLPVGERNSFVTPTFKFFDRRGQLVGALIGAPDGANGDLATALRTVPATFTMRTLREEMAAVGLKGQPKGNTAVVYVMNGFCPPCDNIVMQVKLDLPNFGWTNVKILVVNISRS